jgi:ubiquitin-protein ligase
MQMSGDEGISAFPKDDNLFEWLGTIHGSDGTVYEGLEYKITLKFGPKYPNEPPQVYCPPPPWRSLVTRCSASLRRACSTPTSTRKAATSASTSSPLTSGPQYWM